MQHKWGAAMGVTVAMTDCQQPQQQLQQQPVLVQVADVCRPWRVEDAVERLLLTDSHGVRSEVFLYIL